MSTLIFDLDGTLVDSAGGILASMRVTLKAMGLEEPPEDALRALIGPPLRPTLEKLLGGAEHVEAGVKIYREHYAREGVVACDPFPGMRAALEEMHSAAHTLFVCTAKMETFARAIIENIGFNDLFAGIYGTQYGGAGDNKAELIAQILAQDSIDPRRAIMVGDRREDIVAGRSNGLTTIGVLWGYGDAEELNAAGATALCGAVADLGGLLLRHVGSQPPAPTE